MKDFRFLPDLASERLGGRVIAANDEFFAPRKNLLKESKPIFIEGKFTGRGKWMDGWETRRRRTPGHDWCIVRLGLPGIIRGVVVDTSFFRGNFPSHCSIEACSIAGKRSSKKESAALLAATTKWQEILPKTPLTGDSQNLFDINGAERYTHIRLNIYPDGGVARLRIHGEAIPAVDSPRAAKKEIDLAAIENGALIVAASDEFFSEPLHLLMPGRAKNMGDGWETRRRRGEGHDWVIVKLGTIGEICRVEVDTSHFKGNFPESCSIETASAAEITHPSSDSAWEILLPRTKLRANSRHVFRKELQPASAASHLRLNIFPDGGVSRLRVWGISTPKTHPDEIANLNNLSNKEAAAVLLDCCGSREWVRRMLARRPFGSTQEIYDAAAQIWNELAPNDWLEAFRHHPRIGEKKAARRQSREAKAWSANEQSGIESASDIAKAALVESNRAYEEKFGQIFIVCASEKTTDEILILMRQRSTNDRDTELKIAADEQQKITQLRLERLLAS
ncbi:MAG TPA: allantoicase [Candidatus Acidoferrales bacterium]